MSEIVVDASAFAKLLVYEPGTDRMNELEASSLLSAPDHVLIETANVLWKKTRRGAITAEFALDALDAAERYDLGLAPTADLLQEALAIACELPHPLYDTLYLLLALKGGRALATADARMREAAESLGIRVEWVGAEA